MNNLVIEAVGVNGAVDLLQQIYSVFREEVHAAQFPFLERLVGIKHVQSVILLGSDMRLQFEQRPDGLHIRVPAQSAAKYAYALRVTFDHSSH